ncbi:uncharacterized protein [Battus philenor]|uniref:uncharacterized protein n=1 Tax=Battus philenor TaxID=42288 RepID=UPI0035CE8692
MVNYCCVYGCGRNSRLNKHLNYYSLPKEKHRRIEWLKAACREDLLKKNEDKVAVSYRFCSRHFPPSSIKNRHLSPDAVPSLCLPGSLNEDDVEPQQIVHSDIICDNCSNPIVGFRYKCVSCIDFDLCQKCEMQEAHSNHYMLRIPKPLKFKLADNLTKKWKKLFKSAHVLPNSDQDISSVSSDDEPITKYAKNYDSGVDLSEDVKLKIRKEVNRAMSVKLPDIEKTNIQRKDSTVHKKRSGDDVERPNKRRAIDRPAIENNKASEVITVEDGVPDLVFADVNEIKDDQIIDTNVLPASIPSVIPDANSAVVHVKISDDLSQLVIEMNNTEKMVYKYGE